MTHLVEAADTFVDEALAGLADLHADVLRRVDGGLVRRETRPKVAVVTGGGSGHHPAFAGYVGYGLADGAVTGQLFASPSTAQILRVCDQLVLDYGVVFVFGNYAGDVLNFTSAATELGRRGVRAECLAVTDDVASASVDERARRRGVAGDLAVIKVVGAAAENGLLLDDVVRLGRRANDCTRSFGVAFTGATMPGRHAPMFTVPAGVMSVGLGIHGEPGIGEQPLPPVSEVARLMVEQVWAERPTTATDRVAVVVNGLGSTTSEELFVLWHHVRAELERRGAHPVAPLVGEYVTTLDMAGCSLTLLWLDERTEPLWCAPVHAPVLQRSGVSARVRAAAPASVTASTPRGATGTLVTAPAASPGVSTAVGAAARRLGERIAAVAVTVATALAAAEPELGRLDALAGDGDHGQGMARGSAAAARAARASVARGAGAAHVLADAAEAWADRAGGTSGALWGVALRAAAAESGEPLPGADGAVDTATERAARAARAAYDGVTNAGGAVPGDKTMLDALGPFVSALEAAARAGRPLAVAWSDGTSAATAGAADTAALRPKVGRARPLAARSLGHPDPGAVSLALVVRTVGAALDDGSTIVDAGSEIGP